MSWSITYESDGLMPQDLLCAHCGVSAQEERISWGIQADGGTVNLCDECYQAHKGPKIKAAAEEIHITSAAA